MCILALKYRGTQATGLVLLAVMLQIAFACPVAAADKLLPGPNDGLSTNFFDKEYRLMLREERHQHDQTRSVEKIVSGAAALVIGVYGYYFDRGNIGRQLAYSVTQTAGVFMISSSLLEAESPSVMLELDRAFRTRRNLSYQGYRNLLVTVERRRKAATYKQVAFSSGILSALYLYNAYQERERSVTLRNVYSFLSVNFAVISGASFFQLHQFRLSAPVDVSIGLSPWPTVAMRF